MSSKSSIPAWQRAQQPLKSDTEAPNTQPIRDDEAAPGPEESTPADGTEERTVEHSSEQKNSLSAEEQSQQLEIVRSFLQDPGVKDEPVEKKREFLEQKGIPQDMIDQELGSTNPPPTVTTAPAMSAADFTSFKEAQQTPRTTPPVRPAGPPIITYPEFLEDARKPPPLITPTRILNAAYLASGIAALGYGVGSFLLKPMATSLTEARHDFASHGQSKVDQLNERLSTLVSKIPEPKSTTEETDSDDAESVASDPTELFHRDIGTQTSPAISPQPAIAKSAEATAVDKQNERLSVIQSHLNEMLSGVQAGEQPAKDRTEATTKLRHHLDDMMYRVQTANIWQTGFAPDQKNGAEADDAIEHVKKEIRGVKGVLLSAKRFAPVGPVPGRVGG